MFKAYLSIGSNIEPRLQYLQDCIQKLNCKELTVSKVSSVYQTPPWGNTNQGPFLNMAIEVETCFSPLELLHHCQQVEIQLGRVRHEHWGPRTIDVDILLYESLSYLSEELKIPHPYLHERGFVLVPLLEVNASLCLHGKPLIEYLHLLDISDIESYSHLHITH